MSFDTPRGTRGRKSTSNPLLRLVNRVVVWRARKTGSVTMGPMKVLVLNTTGAKTGEKRETPVGWFPGENGSWLVVASANGAVRNPAWFHNLAAHPDDVTIEVDGRSVPVMAEQLHGAEREAALASIIASAPQFAGYEQKTDRAIPVVRLTEKSVPRA
ncbi:hypothetical protein AFL01nite_08520 [Aeromicrobium flavum]|uniref:Nitroreductase n=1 Tax=Aeromicrobium flavum TaxID=416568 RepID=A0A512HSZ6_9ACTN|nr:nitroreductase/quinone reductase family protein [Aeromicrobium flavum]GEO88525.1 hypothetical protein AFL01nite_08520 [Aeromicrobium flavum]